MNEHVAFTLNIFFFNGINKHEESETQDNIDNSFFSFKLK